MGINNIDSVNNLSDEELVKIISHKLQDMSKESKKQKIALIGTGELTVTIKGRGSGLLPTPQASDGEIRSKFKPQSLINVLKSGSQDHLIYHIILNNLEKGEQIYEWIRTVSDNL